MINSVRNTVLSVLNKNNYGYISPSDFNLFAKQAQMEIFSEYFSNMNKVVNMENSRISGTDNADLYRNMTEATEEFLMTNFLANILTNAPFYNIYSVPTLPTTGDESMLTVKVIAYTTLLKAGTNSSVTASTLTDSSTSFITLGVSVGDVVVNKTTHKSTTVVTVTSATVLTLNDDIFLATPNTYSIYKASDISPVERVSNGKVAMLKISNLVAPSKTFPIYCQTGENIEVLPNTIGGYGAIQAVYYRYPKDPKWTYTSLTNGEPSFDQSQSDYQDFELPADAEYSLVTKILQYCGVSIRETDITQYYSGQEQREQPTFSQKQ